MMTFMSQNQDGDCSTDRNYFQALEESTNTSNFAKFGFDQAQSCLHGMQYLGLSINLSSSP